MVAPLADQFAPELATKLINAFGVSSTLRSTTNVYDLTTGTSTQSVVTSTVKATPPTQYMISPGDDTALVGTSVTYLKGLDGVNVANGETLVLSGRTWTVVKSQPMISGDKTAAYKLWVSV